MIIRNPTEFVLESLGCSQTDLAKKLGVQRATVLIWKKRGAIPVKSVKRVAEVTGIPAYILCPDYFPAPSMSPESSDLPSSNRD